MKVEKCVTIFPDLQWERSVFGYVVNSADVDINQTLTLREAEILFRFASEHLQRDP